MNYPSWVPEGASRWEFLSEYTLTVVTAGRGKRFLDNDPLDPDTKLKRPCYTNAGRVERMRTFNPTERVHYFDCLTYSSNNGCPKLKTVQKAFSVNSDVTITPVTPPTNKETTYKAHVDQARPSNAKCEKYYGEALKAIKKKNEDLKRSNPGSESMINLNNFIKGADRFVVHEYHEVDGKPRVQQKLRGEVCYVKETVAKYGVCETIESPGWGFCSKSCQKSEKLEDELDELEATYYESAPPKSNFKKLGKLINYY